jgi:PST family polysaccharide transporter
LRERINDLFEQDFLADVGVHSPEHVSFRSGIFGNAKLAVQEPEAEGRSRGAPQGAGHLLHALCLADVEILGELRAYDTVYFLTFLGLIGNVLFPVWFFQGMEKMKYITYVNFISRLAATGLVFVIIKSENDFLKFVLLNSVISIIMGIVSLCIVLKIYKVKYVKPDLKTLKENIKEGWYIFISSFSINMYISSNILILGIFASKSVVFYYYIVDRVITAVRSLVSIVFQTTYPYICRLAGESLDKLKRFYRKVFVPLYVCLFLGCLLMFVLSDIIIYLFTGKYLVQSAIVMKILSFVPLIVALNIPAYQTLVAYGQKKSYTLVLLSGSVLNIFLNLVLAYKFLYYGTAVSVLITELYITIGLYLIVEIRHKNYSIFRRSGDING